MAINKQLVQEQMKLGVKAHKAGDSMNARLHFQKALREDPNNIPALLWLAYIDTNFERQIVILERVLKIDPDNERALQGLQWVQKQMAQAEAAAQNVGSIATNSEPTSLEELRNQLETGELKEQARKGTIAQRARRRINPLITLLIGSGVIMGMLLWRLLFPVEQPLLAALAPSSTPLPSPGATATLEPTPLPTNTPASTNTPAPPTATPTQVVPSATPSPTLTPRPLVYQPESTAERWIEVDLDNQTAIAWEGETPVMEFVVSTGLPNTPTVKGQFRIYQKLVSTRMTGPGYDLPDVPYTMYFHGGYALHGAYWHNNFGQPMSHGCVNLSPEDAKTLFEWAGPRLPDDSWYAYASNDNPGTMVVVH